MVIVLILAFAAVAGVLLLYAALNGGRDRSRIRVRYDQMRHALLIGDTNAAQMLFAPALRSRSANEFGRLTIFARELGPRSSILISGSRAQVCPKSLLPFTDWGHTIELIKVDGEWYFTGHVGVF
jgi:hypothetical protein